MENSWPRKLTITGISSQGDGEMRRAAETRAKEIQNAKSFDPKKDTVLLRGVATKQDFKNVIKEANNLEKKYGKVEQLNMYSHAGSADGPILHEARPYNHDQAQFTTEELKGLKINWSKTATARFYGCNTADNFAQQFANAQGVPTFGYSGYAYFSNSSKTMIPDEGRNKPLYLIHADYRDANGILSALRYSTGFGRVYPMVRRNPPKTTRPRR